MRRRYYCVKQHDITDCAAASIATICLQYGKEVSIAKIREIAGTDRFGTTAYGIVKVVEHFGTLLIVENLFYIIIFYYNNYGEGDQTFLNLYKA
ncbi:peptidase C39 bacteriocin processing [Caldicellulosiruptor owensensis OL]|uniref:Peptidase C39 bacteriocin processing n=1 Tax=Caldicellulosiruptor owensensis (strain ATCC 700167 / DSM 13100 / OL) TaxID=632518 RepID=E4Q1K4_CALOW|nr:cysteine peptidase family C39 domain-containing protein [Caldicellulosiruptor owensensis]ADQ04738.1 peptidase C39 bacteriocin processing [Caldicellulosiruptor owensensis OL]